MRKTTSVELGRTQCDFCDRLAELIVGSYVVCRAHNDAALDATDGVKKAAAASVTLKAAGIRLSDLHEDA